MSGRTLTADELRTLLATAIVDAAGGTVASWRCKIGAVTALSLVSHPRSNWSVSPMCGTEDHRRIERAVELMRADHPYVASM